MHADRGTIAVFDPSRFDTPSTKQAAGAARRLGPAAARCSSCSPTSEDRGRCRSATCRACSRPAGEDVGVADLVGAAHVLVSEEALDALTARANGERPEGGDDAEEEDA